MKALTLTQPWAALVAIGAKHLETRSWPAPKALLGQWMAIHAAKGWTTDDQRMLTQSPFRDALRIGYHRGLIQDPDSRNLPRGMVVALAKLTACYAMNDSEVLARYLAEHKEEQHFGHFGPDRYAWYFSEIQPILPIPAKGFQRVWEWDRTAESVTPLKPKTVVVHVRRSPYTVYVGRPMQRFPHLKAVGWGNRFGPWNSDHPIRVFYQDLLRDPRRLRRIHDLQGEVLACWCAKDKPLPGTLDVDTAVCHGQILAALADMTDDEIAALRREEIFV